MGTGRVVWVDTARGIAILLVVLFHSTFFPLQVANASIPRTLAALNPLLDTFRMPFFFFTAGLFASRTIALPFREMFRHRVWPLLWVYLVWCVIYSAVLSLLPWGLKGSRPTFWDGLLGSFLTPNNSLWFLFALALYCLAAWLMRSWPIWAQIGLTAMVSAISSSRLIQLESVAWTKVLDYVVFFVLAVHTARIALASEARAPSWLGWALAPVYLVLAWWSSRLGLTAIPGVRLVLGAVAIVVGVLIAQQLTRAGWRWLSAMGTRTLPIYVVHYYPIFVVTWLLSLLSAPLPRWLGWCVPLVLTGLATVTSLGVHRLLRRVGWLWAPIGRRLQPVPEGVDGIRP